MLHTDDLLSFLTLQLVWTLVFLKNENKNSLVENRGPVVVNILIYWFNNKLCVTM